MARRPRSSVSAEPRGSADDPRVRRVPIPARRLVVVGPGGWFGLNEIQGAIVWLKPGDHSDQELVDGAENLRKEGAARVIVLPRDAEDAVLPAEAGSPAPSHDAASIREAVAELVAELPEAVREPAGARVERLLSEAGL